MRLATAAAAIMDTPEGTPVDRSILLAASAFVAVPPVFPGGIVTTGHPAFYHTKADDVIEYVPAEDWAAPKGTLVMAAYSNGGRSVFGIVVPEYFDGQPDPTQPVGYTIPDLDTLVDGHTKQYREPDEVRVVGPIVGLSRLADRGLTRQGVYDAGGLRFEDYTQWDESEANDLNRRAEMMPRHDERNQPAALAQGGTPDPDLTAILALAPGGAYAMTIFYASPVYGEAPEVFQGPHDLFTVVCLVYRNSDGSYLFQLLQHGEDTGVGGKKWMFEYWCLEGNSDENGGYRFEAQGPDDVPAGLNAVRAIASIHHAQMVEHRDNTVRESLMEGEA